MNTLLIRKYNVQGPRYTSYPTVPYWNETPPGQETWKEKTIRAFRETNAREGISIYIHLPFCESLCTYCGCNTRITTNHSVEQPYIHALLKEWNLYLDLFNEKPRIRELHLGGGTPTFFGPEQLGSLIEALFRSAEIPQDAELSFEAHPNSTTKAHLETLYNTGFRRLSLGIQDFDPRVQEIVNRVQSFEKVKEVTETARKTGYTSINYDLIYGLPLQTLSGITDTIEKVCVLKPDRIAWYSYAHVPWIKPGQRKFTEADLPADAEKRTLYESGRELLEKNGYREVGMDHFALPGDTMYKAAESGTLHRNFMGYTTTKTKLLVGLGASSISDSWDCFVQNYKKVEDYYNALDKNEFPFFRGHALTETDLILRKHILNLMCTFKTEWDESDERNTFYSDIIRRLKEPEADGLVKLSPGKAEVLPKGKPFLRNICMAFDARLHENQPRTEIFSKTV